MWRGPTKLCYWAAHNSAVRPHKLVCRARLESHTIVWWTRKKLGPHKIGATLVLRVTTGLNNLKSQEPLYVRSCEDDTSGFVCHMPISQVAKHIRDIFYTSSFGDARCINSACFGYFPFRNPFRRCADVSRLSLVEASSSI